MSYYVPLQCWGGRFQKCIFSVKFFEKTSIFLGENPFLVNCEHVMKFLANVHKVHFGEPYKAPFKRLIWSLSINRKKKHSSIGTLDLICHLKQLCLFIPIVQCKLQHYLKQPINLYTVLGDYRTDPNSRRSWIVAASE